MSAHLNILWRKKGLSVMETITIGKIMAQIIYYQNLKEKEIENDISSLLKQIGEKHGIESSIREVSSAQGEYKREFAPAFRAKQIKSRTGKSVRKSLSKGKNLKGKITLVDDEDFIWISDDKDPLYAEWKSYDEMHPSTLGFLKMVLDKGEKVIREILNRSGEADHDKLTKAFLNSGILRGGFRKEVPVGIHKRKFIDLVFDTPRDTWVLEVKPRLNATALGQALIYKELYLEEVKRTNSSQRQIKCGIVCRNADEELRAICNKYIDKVFVVGEIKDEK